MEKRLATTRYITGLDGVRALAVFAVIMYHLLPGVFRGGYLGVPVFFVISGFLITNLLCQEYHQNGAIDVANFYVRRMKRLYPALVFMLIFSSAYVTIFQRNLLVNLRSVVFTSLTYVNNFWQIAHGSSYFDRFGNESPYTHIWSLAIEGQFYLFWPLIFILLTKFVRNRSKIFNLLMILSIFSAILMWILYVPTKDPTRVYYGTDTRMFSILLGVALAFIWPSWRLKEKISFRSKKMLNRLGFGSLILLMFAFFFLENNWTFAYRSGIFLVSFLAMILVATVVHPGAGLNKLLTNKFFTYVGKRSYGIYLYQYPIMIFYEAKLKNAGAHPWFNLFIELFSILLISELSYTFIEKPLQKFKYRNSVHKLKELYSKPFVLREKWKVVISSLLVLIALWGFVTAPVNSLTAVQLKIKKQIEENKKLLKKREQDTISRKVKIKGDSSGVDQTKYNYKMTENDRKIASKIPLLAFGDSVILATADGLQNIFPLLKVDAYVGRQAHSSPPELEAKKDANELTKFVLLNLGTNGPIQNYQIDEIFKILGSKTTIFCSTVHVPTRPWQNGVNNLIKKKSRSVKNLIVIDWEAMSRGQKNWFYPDRVHPNQIGASFYANYAAKKIVDNLPTGVRKKFEQEIANEVPSNTS